MGYIIDNLFSAKVGKPQHDEQLIEIEKSLRAASSDFCRRRNEVQKENAPEIIAMVDRLEALSSPERFARGIDERQLEELRIVREFYRTLIKESESS